MRNGLTVLISMRVRLSSCEEERERERERKEEEKEEGKRENVNHYALSYTS